MSAAGRDLIKISLEAMSETHIPGVLAACANWEELSQHGPPYWRPRSSAELRRKIAAMSGPAVAGEYNFVVLHESTMVGECSLHAVDWRSRVAQVGICIWDPANRRKGFGKAATAQLIYWATRHMDLARLEAWVLASNQPSRGMFEALDFAHEGTLHERYVHGGLRHDVDVLGRLL